MQYLPLMPDAPVESRVTHTKCKIRTWLRKWGWGWRAPHRSDYDITSSRFNRFKSMGSKILLEYGRGSSARRGIADNWPNMTLCGRLLIRTTISVVIHYAPSVYPPAFWRNPQKSSRILSKSSETPSRLDPCFNRLTGIPDRMEEAENPSGSPQESWLNKASRKIPTRAEADGLSSNERFRAIPEKVEVEVEIPIALVLIPFQRI